METAHQPDLSADGPEAAERLLREETALKRLAILVARGLALVILLGAVITEAGELFGAVPIQIVQSGPDGLASVVAASLGADGDDSEDGDDDRTSIVAPIVVNGASWGAVRAIVGPGQPPSRCRERVEELAYLLAGAVATVETREEVRDLLEAQSALRRVATLVARGGEPQAVFSAVATEAARLLGVGAVSLIRYDREAKLLTKIYGTHGERAVIPDGGHWTLEAAPVEALIVETEGPVRLDDWTTLPGPVAARHVANGFGQAVAAPVMLDGALWGFVSAFGEAHQVLPQGSEERLAEFTQLMASAISNAETREELRELAARQGAALRRVATLVAQQMPRADIFDAIAVEASKALRVEHVRVDRITADGEVIVRGATEAARRASGDSTAALVETVRRSGRTARSDTGDYSAVAAPVAIDSGIWGAIVVVAPDRLPEDTEARLADFTHLVVSSISNVHARARLMDSRERIVTASDETQRRIERNLHDGIQQRLVGLGFRLRAVMEGQPASSSLRAELEALELDLGGVVDEVRHFSQGLHPALLSRSGLGPSLRELARRSPVPVTLQVEVEPRPREAIETAVYYVISEALANAAKHSRASQVAVTVAAGAESIRATIVDDGVGGAALGHGSGLIGLVDRVEAHGGTFTLDSPRDGGTTITIVLPSQPDNREISTL
jgi:signal transduction histidine kinase